MTTRSKPPTRPATRLAGDVETFCAILARIVLRMIQQQRTRKPKP